MGRPIGVCTWTFGDLSLADIAARVAALGLDGVELLGEEKRYAREHLAPTAVHRLLEDHGLAVFSLTPPNVDLAHPEQAVFQPAVDTYLRLLDFAAAFGAPLVSIHGYVGRVSPVVSQEEEMALLATAVQTIGERARASGLRLVFEVLNRYESHLVNTGAEALAFVERVGLDNVGVLLDAYHMNIEEPDPAAAIGQAGDRLWLYHAADSNRQAIGRGHTDFDAQLTALDTIGYGGPIILEVTAPGPNPFTPIKDEASHAWLERYQRESTDRLAGR